MPRILIVGATGYVGGALAASLVRSGNHTVYGLARSASKAQGLARQEIIPVLCPDLVKDAQPLLDTIESLNITTVVACGADMEAASLLDACVAAGKQRVSDYAKDGLTGPKLGFVYTSGTWVHGSSLQMATDLDPVGARTSNAQPPSLVSWRPEMERKVLAAKDVLDVCIVRPSLVYGRSCAIWKPFFDVVMEAKKTGAPTAKVPLDHCHPALNHVDDVGAGLHLAVEKLPFFFGTGVHPIFDLCGQTENMQDIFNTFAAAVDYKGTVELVGAGDNAFAQAMSVTGNISAGRAKSLLGWEAKRVGFAQGMEVYGKAFAAH